MPKCSACTMHPYPVCTTFFPRTTIKCTQLLCCMPISSVHNFCITYQYFAHIAISAPHNPKVQCTHTVHQYSMHTIKSTSMQHEYLTCMQYALTLCVHQQIFTALFQHLMCTPCTPILCVLHKLSSLQFQILVCSPAHQYDACATNSSLRSAKI
jgi:hypothetical protein